MGRDGPKENVSKKVKKTKLSVKDETVIQAFLKGETKSGAYRKGFKTSKWKSETVNKRASEFFKRENVLGRVDELRGILEESALVNYKEYMKKLNLAMKMSLGEIPIKKVDKAMGTITGCVEVCETDLKAFVGIGKEMCTLMDWYPKENKDKDDDKKDNTIKIKVIR